MMTNASVSLIRLRLPILAAAFSSARFRCCASTVCVLVFILLFHIERVRCCQSRKQCTGDTAERFFLDQFPPVSR